MSVFRGLHHIPTLEDHTTQRLHPPINSGIAGGGSTASRIFVSRLTGSTVILDLDPSETVGRVKEEVYEREGANPDLQRLLFGSTRLEDNDATLESYGVKAGATLYEECVDLAALKDLYAKLNGPEWVSTSREKANRALFEKDQAEVIEVFCPSYHSLFT